MELATPELWNGREVKAGSGETMACEEGDLSVDPSNMMNYLCDIE